MPEQVEQMSRFVAALKEQSTMAVPTSGLDQRMDEDAVKALQGLGYVQ
jgi:hypothetical protein